MTNGRKLRTKAAAVRRTIRLSLIICLPLAPGFAKGQQNASPKEPPANSDLYVGSDTCKACHAAEAASYERGPHWRTETAKNKGPQWHGCESCHGPGKEHVEGGGDPSKIGSFAALLTKKASEHCLQCHYRNEGHQSFLRSAHLSNDVGCTTCHSIHASKAHFLLVSSEPRLCYGCHQSVEPDFSKPAHHRVNEGLMSCSDCHNPHGSFLPHNLRTSSWQGAVCVRCHTDTAGPFVFEHAPLKQQGCVACHNPHGSTNPHLLARPQINQLCLECHSTILAASLAPGVPTFHNQATRYQQCILCHVAVHGSNTDPVFFKR